MKKREFYIVWNEARSEAIVTDDASDAKLAAGEMEPFNFCSTLCERFAGLYGDDRRFVEKLSINEKESQ